MSQNFGFITFPDELTITSNIMPDKKNPDVFELIRGKSNKILALYGEMLLITNNLPSGYHRRFQLNHSTNSCKRCGWNGLKVSIFIYSR